jgi:hypothetical protein
MTDVKKIHFRDLVEREEAEKEGLLNRQQQLKNLGHKRGLTADETKELDRITRVLDAVATLHEPCDTMFVGVREMFNANPGLLGVPLHGHDEYGRLQFERPNAVAARKAGDKAADKQHVELTQEQYIRASLTLGLIMADQVTVPQVAFDEQSGQIRPDYSAPGYTSLSRGFFAAIGETQSMYDLATLVLPLLGSEGDPDGNGRMPSVVKAAEFASLMRALAAKGVTIREPQLRRRINECLDTIQAVGDQRPVADQGIDLPDLETTTAADIVPNNVILMGPMVCAAMFDELKAFQVVDKLVELFQHGMLPIGSGKAGKLLYKYWKEGPNRMSEAERKNFYAMTMGIPGGDSGGMVNREFNDLWIRFVSSVSTYVRQNEVDKLLRVGIPSSVGGQQVRKAARDLAANLSLHGYGMAYYAALDLQDQIRTIIDLLSDDDIKSAYGARDMWQVIDQVATLELGGAKTSARYRTLATCGAIITAWLGNNVARILRPTGPIIDLNEVLSPLPRTNGQKATKQPYDYDLVNACELWLADTATSEARVDELSQPREAPVMTSKPVQIPAIARDMLDSFGMGMSAGGMGAGFGAPAPARSWSDSHAAYPNGHARN